MEAGDVGERIRQARAGLGLTQDEFARRLGVTRISVARYEAGRVPNLGLLQLIAQLAGVTVGWLVGGVTDEKSPPLIDRSVSLEFAEAHRRLLAFLRHQSIASLEQELEEYRQLLESRAQAAGSGRKRRARKGRSP
jgi:transcriptional regulator with XRE-family HTH domain